MPDDVRFLCDAMLGGLARWLRVAGYEAEFDVHVADGPLVRRAHQEGRWLLTSDSGLMERYAVAAGLVSCLFVPRGLPPVQQLAHVLGRLGLGLREPRCMACGGGLADVALDKVRAHVPVEVQGICRQFYRCTGCGKVYWRGTHWQSIRRQLAEAAGGAGAA